MRKGVIKQLLIPTFNCSEYCSTIFFLTFLIFSLYIGHTLAHNKKILIGWTLLAILWIVSATPRNKHSHWKSLTGLSELYKSLLERENAQLLKLVYSPFATEPIANNIGCRGEVLGTDLIMYGSYNLESSYLMEEDCSRGLDEFVKVL